MKRVRIEIVQGVGGFSLYMNDLRVAGAKPWAGGKVVQEWFADARNVREALRQPAERIRPDEAMCGYTVCDEYGSPMGRCEIKGPHRVHRCGDAPGRAPTAKKEG